MFRAPELIDLIRKKRDVTCSLDRNGQSSLVLCAVSGDTARQDLASLGDVLSQSSGVLIDYKDTATLRCTFSE